MSKTSSRRLRGHVAQRDGGVCVDCPPGTPAHPYEQWEADHVIPFVHGGEDTMDNLVTRCKPHHRAKTRAEGSNVGRPSRGMVMSSFYLGRDMKAWIDDLAVERGETKANTTRTLLTYAFRYMSTDPDEDPPR